MQNFRILAASRRALSTLKWTFFCYCVTPAILALADGPAVPAGSPAGGGGAPGQPGLFGMLFPFVLMFGVIYFLMIRPQQKRMKEHQAMMEKLKHGDEVLTASGMLGTIAGITEKIVTLDVGNNCKIKMLKTQISKILDPTAKDVG